MASGSWSLMARRAGAIFRARYAAQSLGAVWHVVHPLVLIGMYSLIFGWIVRREFAGMSSPYPIFLCAGLLPWLAFSEVLGQGTMSFRANRVYLRKLAVPEFVFVGEVTLCVGLSLAIQFLILGVVGLGFGVMPRWGWLAMPLPLLLLGLIATGLALGLATLNAYFADVHQALIAALRLAIWAAPIIFPVAFYTENGLGWLVHLNPASAPISAVRSLYLDGVWPSTALWIESMAWTLGSLVIGVAIYRALRSEIRDVV